MQQNLSGINHALKIKQHKFWLLKTLTGELAGGWVEGPFYALLCLGYTGKKLKAYNYMQKLKQKLKNKEKIEFYIIFIFSLLKLSPNIIL